MQSAKIALQNPKSTVANVESLNENSIEIRLIELRYMHQRSCISILPFVQSNSSDASIESENPANVSEMAVNPMTTSSSVIEESAAILNKARCQLVDYRPLLLAQPSNPIWGHHR